MQLQAKEYLEPTAAERGKDEFSPSSFQGECDPVDTWLNTSGLNNNIFLLF